MCLSSLKTKETKKKQEQKIVGIRRRNHKQMEESKNKKIGREKERETRLRILRAWSFED